jgi:hypothetical protein
MPIRINLLNEHLAEEDLRRRDPVKRALFIGGFLVALSLVWLSSVFVETKLVQQKKAQVENEIRSHTNDFSRVQSDLKKIAEGQKRLGALQQLSANRFLQGNLMNALQQVYVPNVQLIKLKVEQSYAYKEGSPQQTTANGVVPGRPATSTEHIVVILDAKDSSPSPGDAVNRYKDAIAKLDYFKSSLNLTNGVSLANLSAPQTAPNGKPFVLFTLECRFTDKTR